MNKQECIEILRRLSDRYGDKLVDLMEKYNAHSLAEVTEEQANEYVELMSKRRNTYEKMAYGRYSGIQGRVTYM